MPELDEILNEFRSVTGKLTRQHDVPSEKASALPSSADPTHLLEANLAQCTARENELKQEVENLTSRGKQIQKELEELTKQKHKLETAIQALKPQQAAS